jgi:hypothetical protein
MRLPMFFIDSAMQFLGSKFRGLRAILKVRQPYCRLTRNKTAAGQLLNFASLSFTEE